MFIFKQTRAKELFRRQWGYDPRELAAACMTRDRMKYIRMYYELYRGDERGWSGIDEITWSDLEMDEVFLRINHTRSFAGEQVLYRLLHEPDSADHLDGFEKLVSIFGQDEAGRMLYERRLSGIGKVQTDYYLPSMLQIIVDHDKADLRFYKYLQLLFVSAMLGMLFLHSVWCTICMLLIACINLTVYIVMRSKQEGMFSCLKSICIILRFCRFAESNWPLADESVLCQVRSDLALLKKAEQAAGSFAARKAAASNSPQDLLGDYIWGMTLIDLIIYEKILRSLAGRQDTVLRLFHFAGMIDAAISCASFRQSLELWCQPAFRRGDNISFQGLYHPLLRKAVRNDGTLGKNTIITGANASGKSTFMKAVAVNVILAQTIHTCTASAFTIPPMDVMSSMAIRDDILLGESYYIREVRYMKRMLEKLEARRPVLFVMDEIMRGTNQKERLAVSEAVLRYLARQSCFVIAATHDYELVEKLGPDYKRYYFGCQYEGGTLQFDYLIRPGFNSETNAVRLLKQFNFPKEILKFTDQMLQKGDSS